MARDKKKGSATFTVTVPGPGVLTTSGKGVNPAEVTAAAAGDFTLPVKPRGKTKRKLKEDGKAKLKLGVIYTPTGGSPGEQSLKLKLKKKH